MANTYVIGGKGTGADCSANNGGGFLTGGTATYATFQGTNGGPTAAVTTGTITTGDNGSGKVQLIQAGAFCAGAVVGQLANVSFIGAGDYASGRYVILDVGSGTLDIDLTYSAGGQANASAIYCGGALDKLETVDGLLTSGDTLLIPNGSDSQRTYTESNTCTIASASAGATINLIGVQNAGTGITAVRDTPTSGLFPNGLLNEAQFPKIAFATTKYLSAGAYDFLSSLQITGDIDGSSGAIVNYGSSDYAGLSNVVVANAGQGYCVFGDGDILINNCDLLCTAADHTYYVVRVRGNSKLRNCRLRSDGTDPDGLFNSGASFVGEIIGNVFYNLAAGVAIDGITIGSIVASIEQNTFYSVPTCITTSNGAGTVAPLLVRNNIAVNCTNFLVNGYAATADQHLYAKNNVYYNVTNVMTDADWYGISATQTLGFTALSADPFGNAANGDFTASNTADTRAKIIGKGPFGGDLGATTHDPDYPAVDSVVTTDTVNGEDGDYASPATSIVKDGEFYGPDSSYEGEYAGGGGGGLLQGNKRGNKQ